MANTKMKTCKHCGAEIAKNAKVCPQCGGKNKKPIYLRAWFIILAVVIILAAIGGGKNGSSSSTETAKTANVSTGTITNKSTQPKSAAMPDPTPTEDLSVPAEYRAALRKAKTYSDVMFMSKKGIYDQLTSEYGEKFPADAAQYAMDNLDADYNYNALKKAETYSSTMHMSKKGIYDQLTSEYGEQFTPDEAQYAVDHIEADWNLNALEKAKTYREMMDMSNAALHDQLTSAYGEQFTSDEADYAIAHLDD